MDTGNGRERTVDRRSPAWDLAALLERAVQTVRLSGVSGLAIVGGALAAGPDLRFESVIRLAAAWLAGVALGAGAAAGTGSGSADHARDQAVGRDLDHAPAPLVLITRLVIAWFLGGVAFAAVLGLSVLERIRPVDTVARHVAAARPALVGILLPALIAWGALGGAVPVPAALRIDSGLWSELSALIAANWLAPVVFSGVAVASARAGRLSAATGLFVAATALAFTDRVVGAAIFGIALAGGLAVDGTARRRPIGPLLLIAGLALVGA